MTELLLQSLMPSCFMYLHRSWAGLKDHAQMWSIIGSLAGAGKSGHISSYLNYISELPIFHVTLLQVL